MVGAGETTYIVLSSTAAAQAKGPRTFLGGSIAQGMHKQFLPMTTECLHQ